jgi:hypothetical protein
LEAFLERELHLLIQARKLDRLESVQPLKWEASDTISIQSPVYRDIELLEPTSPTELPRSTCVNLNEAIRKMNDQISEGLGHFTHSTDSVSFQEFSGPLLSGLESAEKKDVSSLKDAEYDLQNNREPADQTVPAKRAQRSNSATLRLRANRSSFTALPNSVFLINELSNEQSTQAEQASKRETVLSNTQEQQQFRSRLPSLHRKQSATMEKEPSVSFISEESSFMYIQEEESVDVVPVRHYDM